MRAIAINEFGGPEVFQEITMPTPHVGEGQVLVEVRATSVNPVDYKIRSGQAPFLAPSFPAVLHPDAAGVVTAVGPGVNAFSVGDNVMSFAGGLVGKLGGLAEFIAVDSRMIAKVPSNISFLEAAALPLVSVTSWYAMVDAVELNSETSVLIVVGTGGVGHVALQIAKWRGAHVVAACGDDEKCRVALELGADQVINYRNASDDDYKALSLTGEGYDVVFNTPGRASIDMSVKACRFGGTILDILGDFPQASGFQIKWLTFKSLFAGHEIVFGQDPSRIGKILTAVAELVETGSVRPLLDPRKFSISEIGAAHAYAETASPIGKVVVSTGPLPLNVST